jgi:small multidrug resistance family-3 protein
MNTTEGDNDTKPIGEAQTAGGESGWTAGTIAIAVVLFILAGFAEIFGGWFVWVALRGSSDSSRKPWWYALIGSMLLIIYGFIPTLQPVTDSFGRVYAVYGGFFIVLSFLIGWWMEGEASQPDIGDAVGGGITMAGVLVILFWPR